jgi:hypothetical protein
VKLGTYYVTSSLFKSKTNDLALQIDMTLLRQRRKITWRVMCLNGKFVARVILIRSALTVNQNDLLWVFAGGLLVLC